MDLVELYCKIDDFLTKYQKNNCKLSSSKTRTRNRKFKLSNSEVMTILVMFHSIGFRNLKSFYLNYMRKLHSKDFPELISYNRFVELQKKIMEPLMLFLMSIMGKCTGISFIDSTKLAVCNSKRIYSHKVFKQHGAIAKSTMGWYFGFKLHLVINDLGEILSLKITKANYSDTKPLLELSKNLSGKLIGDKGYISKNIANLLRQKGIELITGIRKNMKNKLMPLFDKILLRKRSVIESVNDQLKNISQIEHTRHRSVTNFLINILSGLVAYSLKPKKPSINIERNMPNLIAA